MTTQWTISIDWNRDGDFDDTYEDVTARTISANWFLGMNEPYLDAADNSVLTLVLDNTDRLYSPEYSGSPLTGNLGPFKPIRIQSDDGSTVRTHWIGWVESIQPSVNKYGQRVVNLVATGSLQFLKAAETNLALQENKRTDEIIDALMAEVVIPPALSQAWVLGRNGNSNLGTSTYLANTSAYCEREEGVLSVSLAADNWVLQGGLSDVEQDTFNVYHAIRDVTAAERGRFFFDRTGKALFWNRNHLTQAGTPVATFDDTMTDMTYAYAGLEHCKNEVIVACHPRTISAAANEVLWELSGAVISIAAGETRDVYVKYKDDNGNRVGGKAVYITDLAFNQGSAVASVTGNANGAELKFVNKGTTTAIVTACKVRGYKITDFGLMEARVVDQDSIIDYGRRTLKLNLPTVDDLAEAQTIAEFEADRRGQPRGTVNSITVVSHGVKGGAHHANQLALTIGDRITVRETQTAHESNYTIIGEAHELTNGMTLMKTTWYLEPAP